MTQDLIIPPPRRRSAETWAAARADYLSGATAPEVCERHGLSLSTFRWRARTEGWRRADMAVGSPFLPLDDTELDEIDHGLPLNAADMARLAWSNAARAMREGKMLEVRGWTRLHDELSKLVDKDEATLRRHDHWRSRPEWIEKIPVIPPLRPMEED